MIKVIIRIRQFKALKAIDGIPKANEGNWEQLSHTKGYVFISTNTILIQHLHPNLSTNS
jgi:hypothetical protein